MRYSTLCHVSDSQSARLAILALAVFLGNAQADPVPLYTVTEITGFTPSSFSSALNDLGQVAGNAFNGSVAAIWSRGAVTTLPMLPGGSSGIYVATGINDSGQVVGTANISSGFHGFIYSSGITTDLGTPDANAINNSGQVTGISNFGHAYLYSNGIITDLGTLGGTPSEGVNINNSGQVVGSSFTPSGHFHAFLYSNGIMNDLGTLPGGISSGANGINNSGQVVGGSDTSSGAFHAFLYSTGVMTDLGTLPGARTSLAKAVNDSGQIVGESGASLDPSTFSAHAFLSANGVMTDLNSLIDPSLNVTLLQASAINNVGQILASGTRGSYLLTPVPEPSAWFLCAGGLAAFVAVRRKNSSA
jgi:probable HAF family extracellular repeat protein